MLSLSRRAVTIGSPRGITRPHWRRALPLALLAGLALAGCGSTGGAQPIQTAVLGGTRPAFTAKYGAPTSDGASDYRYTFSAQGESLLMRVSLATGSDGRQHAIALSVISAAQANLPVTHTMPTWDEGTASKVSAALLPTDATHVSDLNYMTAQGAVTGITHVYRSAALAATFAAALFVNDQNRPIAPGTFMVNCVLVIAECDIGLGHVSA